VTNLVRMPSFDWVYPFVALFPHCGERPRPAERERIAGVDLPVFEQVPMPANRVLDASDVSALDATQQRVQGAEPAVVDDHGEVSASRPW
jgi:hypothetical protein